MAPALCCALLRFAALSLHRPRAAWWRSRARRVRGAKPTRPTRRREKRSSSASSTAAQHMCRPVRSTECMLSASCLHSAAFWLHSPLSLHPPADRQTSRILPATLLPLPASVEPGLRTRAQSANSRYRPVAARSAGPGTGHWASRQRVRRWDVARPRPERSAGRRCRLRVVASLLSSSSGGVGTGHWALGTVHCAAGDEKEREIKWSMERWCVPEPLPALAACPAATARRARAPCRPAAANLPSPSPSRSTCDL